MKARRKKSDNRLDSFFQGVPRGGEKEREREDKVERRERREEEEEEEGEGGGVRWSEKWQISLGRVEEKKKSRTEKRFWGSFICPDRRCSRMSSGAQLNSL